MSARSGLTIVYNVLVVERRPETRTLLRNALAAHRGLRLVGSAPSLARACAIATRKDVDIVVIGHVAARTTQPLAALLPLVPYARVVLYATDLPGELDLDLREPLVAPDLAALADAVSRIIGQPLVDLVAETAPEAAVRSSTDDPSTST